MNDAAAVFVRTLAPSLRRHKKPRVLEADIRRFLLDLFCLSQGFRGAFLVDHGALAGLEEVITSVIAEAERLELIVRLECLSIGELYVVNSALLVPRLKEDLSNDFSRGNLQHLLSLWRLLAKDHYRND